MQDKAEKIALFRYGLIAPLVLETLARGELTRRAQEIAARLYDIPYSGRRSLSVDTLLALASQHNQAGLSASTLYRFLRARGLTERQLLREKATAHKKYEAEFAGPRGHPIWQSDLLFGPWVQRPGGGKMQVFLQAVLDDASRLVPHAQLQDRALAPLRARAVSGQPGRQSPALARAAQRTLLALDRHRLSPHRAQRPPGHAAGPLAARSALRRRPFPTAPRPNNCSSPRPGTRSKRGWSSWPSITAWG